MTIPHPLPYFQQKQNNKASYFINQATIEINNFMQGVNFSSLCAQALAIEIPVKSECKNYYAIVNLWTYSKYILR